MTTQTKCFSTISGGKIDRSLGIISGVAVITEGVAKGHGISIDSKTLSSVLKVASEFSTGVKVKLRHRQENEHQNTVAETAGVLKNFSIEGNKVRADFHLLKSLPADTKEKIFEMAEIMPDQFGFSIAFSGVSETVDNIKFARCEELQSIDLSDNPAANPDGLFSVKQIKYESGEKGKHAKDCDCEACEKSKSKSMSSEDIQASITKLTELVNGLQAKLDAQQPATVLSYKDADGKLIQLSGEQIAASLSQSKELVEQSKKTVDATLRNSIIKQMDSEGRVPMNPASKKAYTLAELNSMPIETLQFAAVNSPVIPMEARAIYRGEGKPAIDPKLTGSARTVAAWSEKYGSLAQMLETPITSTI